MIIAIDGPAASGKGTLAKILAEKLGLFYIDTGSTYRLVALKHLEDGMDPLEAAQWVHDEATAQDFTNPRLREREVGAESSRMAATPGVRPLMVDVMRQLAQMAPSGAILDGRDIGTHVFPDANYKLYVTADPEIRAERRAKELQSKGFDVSYEAVLGDLRERDERDSTRSEAPLRPAEDAVMFDTSRMTIDQMVVEALSLFAGKQKT